MPCSGIEPRIAEILFDDGVHALRARLDERGLLAAANDRLRGAGPGVHARVGQQ